MKTNVKPGYIKTTITLTPETIGMMDVICRDMGVSRSAFITMMVRYLTMAEKMPFSRIMEMVLEDGLKGAKKKHLKA